MLCEDARALHNKLYCAVCQQYKDRIHGMNTFYVLKLLGQIICNVMDHAILSIVIAYSFINNCT